MSRSVGKIVGAIVGVALVYFTGGAAAGWVYGVAAAAGAAYGDYVARQSARIGDQGGEPSSRTIRSSKEPVHYLVGRFANGGVLTWVEQDEGDPWVHLVLALSEGPIDGVDDVLLDKKSISEFTGNVAQYQLSVTPTESNTFMRNNAADWDEDVIGKGLSFIRVSLRFDPEQFPNGLPEIQVIGRGRKDIWDPRTDERGYTDNPALILLWWLTEGRANVPLDEINLQSFIDAANVCDEIVENPDGTQSKRYTMGAVISDSELTPDVIDKILATCNGQLIRIGGVLSLQVGAYYGPGDITLTEDMVIGAVSGATEVDNANAINTLTGTFTNPDDWTETDFPPVRVDEWVLEDGAELAESMQIRYVLDPYQAQRLANMHLRKRRNGGAISIPMNFNGYRFRPGRVVNVDLPSINMTGEFIVVDWTLGAADGCVVHLEAYDAGMFDDDVGRPYTPPGFISMPTGGIETPTNLAFLPSNDPMIKQGTVTWTPPPQPVQYYGVTIRREGEAVQTYQVPWSATSCDIQGLGAGQYVIEIYARGELGRSGTASVPINLTVPEPPIDLRLEVSNNVIVCRPLVNNPGFGTEFEMCINYLNDPDFIPFDQLTGLYGTFPGLTPDTDYSICARTISPLGKSEWFSQVARTANNPAEIIPSIREELDQIELRIDDLQPSRLDVREILDRIGEDVAETVDRASDIRQEQLSRVDAIRKEQLARVDAIRKEQMARVDAIRKEQMDRADAVRQERLTRETQIVEVNERIDTETEQRITQINGIVATLDDEIADRQASILQLSEAITDEASTRATQFNSLDSKIDDETSARESAITQVQEAITDEASTRATQVNQLSSRIDDEESARQSQIDQVSDAIRDGLDGIDLRIDSLPIGQMDVREILDRIGEDTAETTRRASDILQVNEVITDEASTRAMQFNLLSSKIEDESSARESSILQVQDAIVNESSTRATQFNQLDAKIEDETSARESSITQVNKAITDEASTRATQFNSLSSRIDDEESTRQSQINQVNQAITDEASTRASAIQSLSADVEDGLSATNDRIDSVEVDVDGNAQSISAVQGQVNDPENNSSALYGFVQQAQSTADGAVTSITAIESRVESNEDFAAAQLLLNSEYEDEFGRLSARAALITDNNGRITGVIVDDDGNERVVEFIADSVRFVDGSGTLRVYYDLGVGRFVFDGDIVARSLSGQVVNANNLVAGAVTADKLSADAVDGKTITGATFVVDSGGSNEYFEVIRAEPFGNTSDLVNWYGPKINGVTWNSSAGKPIYSGMAKSNAKFYKTKDGGVFFGGTFVAGVLSSSQTTTQLTSTASTILDFGSQGGDIYIAASLTYTRYAPVNDGPAHFTSLCPTSLPTAPTGNVILERWTGSAWAVVKQESIVGSGKVSCLPGIEAETGPFPRTRWPIDDTGANGAVPAYVLTTVAKSFTYIDTLKTTSSRRYRLRINLTGAGYFNDTWNTTSQFLTITTSEG